jgi:hypothetical protein
MLPLEAGVNLFAFDNSSITPGLYTIQISNDQQHSLCTEKIFKNVATSHHYQDLNSSSYFLYRTNFRKLVLPN